MATTSPAQWHYLMPIVLCLLIAFPCLCLQLAVADSDTCFPTQYIQFRQKRPNEQFPIIENPYLHPSKQYLDRVRQNIANKQRVCAIKYSDDLKSKYDLQVFDTKADAQSHGWIVTHQGTCGKCSTLRDLYVYLTVDLTRPVRSCGVKHFASHKNLKKCIENLRFSQPCTEVWLWNTLNTKKHCGSVCMWSLLTKQPFVVDGHLNKCLQCDEDISGPIFKYQSGRTRRNSGIKSEIDRPDEQIYNMNHCYF